MKLNFSRSSLLCVLIAVFFPFIFYLKILNGFFQQDEWYGFGWSVLHRDLGFLKTLAFFLAPTAGHYNPLTIAVTQFLFTNWGMDYTRFAVLGIILHLCVIVSVYFLAKNLFRGNNFLSFLTALLFGIFASTYQGTSWVVADISTLSATLIGIVSCIFFLKYLNQRKSYQLTWSLILLTVSLFFKEVTIGLFPLFFLTYIFYGKGKKGNKRDILKLIIVPFGYISLRVLLFFMPHDAGTGVGVSVGSAGILKTIYNFLTIPVKSISQTIFPISFLEILSRFIAKLFPAGISGLPGTTAFDVFSLERVMEVISLSIGIFILCFSIAHVIKKHKINKSFLIFFGLGWSIFGSFIFSISPGTNGVVFAVDSRNLYFTSIGISIFIIYICSFFSKDNIKRTFLILLPIIIFNIYFLNRSLTDFVQTGTVRKDILGQITREYPRLPDNTVFYTESDTSFYGLPENTRILPFQSGFGQTLLAWYEQTNNFPKDFFSNNFLWPIDSQGYSEINGVAFGYYRDFEDLAKFIDSKKIDKKYIISFSFDSQTNVLSDITKQIRGRIDGYEAKKRAVNPRSFKITSSVNQQYLGNVFDGNVKTYWDSKVAYSNYQYVQVDMGKLYNIAQVTIDSGTDPNQKEVGYRIEISKDKNSWVEVFKSKKYPATNGSKDNLYFEPTVARYIKIEQIGNHKYASWIINELSIYEKI